MRWLLPLIILLVGIGGAVALVKSKPEREPLASEERAWNVAVSTLSLSANSPSLVLLGQVDSPRVATLSAAIQADVVAVLIKEGIDVGDGQALISLDDREAALLLEQREAEVADIQAQMALEQERHGNDRLALAREKTLVALSRREVERAENLANRNVGSRSQLDVARSQAERQAMALESRQMTIREHTSRAARLDAQLKRALAFRERAALDLSRTRVTAPFAGRITDIHVAQGDRVSVGNSLLTIQDTTAVEIRAQIPLKRLEAIRQYLGHNQRIDAYALSDGRTINSTLERISGRVAKGRGGADAVFKVTTGGSWLQLGRTVELIVQLPPIANTAAIPHAAIYGTDRIFLLVDGRMQSTTIQRIGAVRTDTGETLALVQGESLNEGDQLIVTQLPNAIDGLKVRVAPR